MKKLLLTFLVFELSAALLWVNICSLSLPLSFAEAHAYLIMAVIVLNAPRCLYEILASDDV